MGNHNRPWNRGVRWLLPLGFSVVLLSGCTSALWDKETFAHQYWPANPDNLELAYSEARGDILVQYDECRDGVLREQPRAYWLEPNLKRLNRSGKPRFVSPKQARALESIPVEDTATAPASEDLHGLHARVSADRSSFTLYDGDEPLNQYPLPIYDDPSQTVKQVLLTPFAVAIDATLVGAAFVVLYGPYWLPTLND